MLPTDQKAAHYDIVISGAGMVGALQALMLARLAGGLRILVIEQGDLPFGAHHSSAHSGVQRSFDGRRLALSRGTLAVLQQLNLWSALIPNAVAITDIQVWSPGKLGRALLSAREQGIDALGYGVMAADLGAVLMAAARSESSINWFGRTHISQLQPLSSGWQLQLSSHQDSQHPQDSQHRQTVIDTALLIIAEGADSPTRARLGITHRHYDYQQTACVAVVAVQHVAAGFAYEAMLDQGSLALLPISLDRMAMIWVLPTEQMQHYRDSDDATRLAALQQVLGRRLTLQGFVNAPTYYPLIDQHAAEQVRPHAVVLGNAAHTLHPIAGQGFNLAVRDLVALTELTRLSLEACRSLGELSALQIYAAQRTADQARIHAFCHGVVKGFRGALPGADHLRRMALLLLDVSPALKVGLAQRVLAPRPTRIQTEIQHAWQQNRRSSTSPVGASVAAPLETVLLCDRVLPIDTSVKALL